MCPVQAVLREGLIASHQAAAAAAADLPGFPECPEPLSTPPGLSTCGDTSPGVGPMRGQLYSEEGPRDVLLLLPGQGT